jgi:hypothetical protein
MCQEQKSARVGISGAEAVELYYWFMMRVIIASLVMLALDQRLGWIV